MLEERSSLGLWISIRGGRRFGSRSSNGGFEAVRKAEKKVSSFSVLLKKFLDWGKKNFLPSIHLRLCLSSQNRSESFFPHRERKPKETAKVYQPGLPDVS
jgi:hypothetical protein